MDDLLNRVKKCKEQTGISYKRIYTQCGISVSVFYNFTSGVRKLNQFNQSKLDEYLKKLGY